MSKSDNQSKGNINKKPKTKVQKAIKVILIILITLVVLVAGVVAGGWTYIQSMLGEMQQETIDENAVGIDNETANELKDYKNIALLGIDSRADDYGLGNRSDCIIIASINEKTNDVKLISVYRDTYLQLVENGTTKLDKVTHAYSYGGAQNTLLALDTNLDLNIKQYLTVNFDTVITAVDALGGVNIKIENDELKYINEYIDATSSSSGITSTHISSAGNQKLDGVQAVAYSRIRYTSGKDYKRTARMRTVLEAIIQKAQSQGIQKELTLLNTILPEAQTNISTSEMKELIPKAVSWKLTSNFGWPYNTTGVWMDGDFYGPAVTLESNVKQLHQEVFGEENYEASDTVKAISAAVIKKTGLK